MGIFDTEDIYPNDDFWLEEGFFNLKRRGTWINIYTKHLHWDVDTCTRWGYIKICVEYNKYSKILKIVQRCASNYYEEVDFEPIILHKPTHQEIQMALTDNFLSSRLTYKHK